MVYIERMFTTMGPAFARQQTEKEEQRMAPRDRETYHWD